MISRLVFSSFRFNFSNFNNTQKRNFRRLASTSSTLTAKFPSTPSLIPGLKISVTPGVSITPKRGPNSYAVFLAEKSKELHQEKPDLKLGEITKRVAAQWRGLNENDRRPYAEEAARIQKEYDDAFMRMSSDEFRKLVLEEMQRLQSKRVTALRRQQRLLKEAHQFPQADPAYFKLAALGEDRSEEIGKGIKATERFPKLAEIWSKLSESEKSAYEKREKAARSKYKKDVESWEKKMKSQGLQDVVDTVKLRMRKKISLTGVGRRRRVPKVLASKVALKKQATAKKAGTAKKTTAKKTKRET